VLAQTRNRKSVAKRKKQENKSIKDQIKKSVSSQEFSTYLIVQLSALHRSQTFCYSSLRLLQPQNRGSQSLQKRKHPLG